MNGIDELGLLIRLENKNIAIEGAEKLIAMFEKHDKNGELENVVEDLRQSVMALTEERESIFNQLENE